LFSFERYCGEPPGVGRYAEECLEVDVEFSKRAPDPPIVGEFDPRLPCVAAGRGPPRSGGIAFVRGRVSRFGIALRNRLCRIHEELPAGR